MRPARPRPPITPQRLLGCFASAAQLQRCRCVARQCRQVVSTNPIARHGESFTRAVTYKQNKLLKYACVQLAVPHRSPLESLVERFSSFVLRGRQNNADAFAGAFWVGGLGCPINEKWPYNVMCRTPPHHPRPPLTPASPPHTQPKLHVLQVLASLVPPRRLACEQRFCQFPRPCVMRLCIILLCLSVMHKAKTRLGDVVKLLPLTLKSDMIKSRHPRFLGPLPLNTRAPGKKVTIF